MVRVIDETGNQIGILPISEALKQAQIKNLDLVEIVPNANPPVCKIIDYKKYLYQKEKQKREKRSKQKSNKTRIIRIGPTTSNHDLEIKARQIDKFLENGDKVKIDMILRGREKMHQDIAKEKFQILLNYINKTYKIDQELKKQPHGLSIIIV